jgi:phosphate transport system substrate-binding protein
VKRLLIALWILLVALGCGKEPGSTRLTEGKLVIECDESVFPTFEKMAAEFGEQYPDAHITFRPAEARAAIADFFNDSVKVIVSGRPFNKEERDMLSAAKIEFQEWHVAQSAVAVISHLESGVTRLRMSEADSLFGGVTTTVAGRKKGRPIELVVGDINASTNEAFRTEVMKGRKYTVTATPMKTSADIVRYVTQTPNTIGIVGIAWL